MNDAPPEILAARRSYAEEFALLWTNPEIDSYVEEWAQPQVRKVLNRQSVIDRLVDITGEIPPDLPWDRKKAMDAAMLLLKAARATPDPVLPGELDEEPAESLQSMVDCLLGPFDYLAGSRE